MSTIEDQSESRRRPVVRDAGRDLLVVLAVLAAAAGATLGLLPLRSQGFFLGAFGAATVAALALAAACRLPALKSLFLAVSAIAFSLLFAEGALALVDGDDRQFATSESFDGDYKQFDPELGYALIPGSQTRHRKWQGERRLFDVTYTIDRQGMRVTESPVPGAARGTDIFVGCSFTFGSGLADTETLPAAFAREQGLTARVLNQGMPGYGPHNVLRSLEVHRFEPVAPPPVRWVVFSTLADHVRRAAGLSFWENGPRYEVDPAGHLEYLGPIRSYRTARLLSFLSRSHLFALLYQDYTELYEKLYDPGGDRAITRYGAITERIKELVDDRYHANFVVVLWDEDDVGGRIAAELSKRQIRFFTISQIIPDYRDNKGLYQIPVDQHPSAAANRLIARFLHDHLT